MLQADVREYGAVEALADSALEEFGKIDILVNNATIERTNKQMLTATFKGDVFFDFNSSLLKPGGYAELDRVAGVLNQYPQTLIRIEGHTDQIGDEQYNQQLSERRADAVRNALLQRGIDPARMTAVGMGGVLSDLIGQCLEPTGIDAVVR